MQIKIAQKLIQVKPLVLNFLPKCYAFNVNSKYIKSQSYDYMNQLET